jgi:ribosomal protein S9
MKTHTIGGATGTAGSVTGGIGRKLAVARTFFFLSKERQNLILRPDVNPDNRRREKKKNQDV